MKFKFKMFFVLAFLVPITSEAAGYCGDIKPSFGPFDYRKISTEYVQEGYLVESAHFTPDVENLVKGNTGQIGGDLAYTLSVFPNHHRALATLAKMALRSKLPKDSAMKYSYTCYFERAMRFTPNDDSVYTIYGTYLYKRGDVTGAEKELTRALEINPNNAPANYNLALIYLHQNKVDQAVPLAKKAYSLDYPIQGLKNRLVAAGKWDGH